MVTVKYNEPGMKSINLNSKNLLNSFRNGPIRVVNNTPANANAAAAQQTKQQRVAQIQRPSSAPAKRPSSPQQNYNRTT